MKELLWSLFKETGDIRYYHFLNRLEGSKENGNRKSRRNSNKNS